MVSGVAVDIGLGVYLGILAGIFPAVVAFALGFVFKYFTGVSIPGLGVVVLAGALAGISGGLLGLLDDTVAQSASGMTAFLVVLMLSLWAHSQGDKLGDTVPRQMSFSQLHRTSFSAEFLERVDSYWSTPNQTSRVRRRYRGISTAPRRNSDCNTRKLVDLSSITVSSRT